MTAPTLTPALLDPGRWIVDAAASSLRLETTFRGLFALRGRFTQATGHLDVDDRVAGCRMHVDVATASLTTGSAARDAMLAAAGLVDPTAGPLLGFRSHRVVRRAAGLLVEGAVSTDRAVAPLRLAVELPRLSGGTTALRAWGRIPRKEIGALLTRPGMEQLLGPTAALNLTVAVHPS
ncbi:YceI family protein [Pseudonocardia sp. CA-107938]|uniref:YceI family protein n=1 Tax=Pseudonocardia sp. CA-107938 TaxID=3240021 RepID=UPI003D8D4C6F